MTVAAPDLFTALDTYLRTNQARLKEVFEEFDFDRSGKLDRMEIKALLTRIMPSITEAQASKILWGKFVHPYNIQHRGDAGRKEKRVMPRHRGAGKQER